MVQLREKHLAEDAFLAEAERFVALCREAGVISIINDNVDIAMKTGADGVHVGQEDLAAGRARELRGGGMRGVAVISALFGADDIAGAARALKQEALSAVTR